MLRPRIDLLCLKFTNKIRRERNKHVLDEMLRVNIDPRTILNKEEAKKSIDSLDDYIASLNIDEGDLDAKSANSDHTLDFALGTYWKLEVNKTLETVRLMIIFKEQPRVRRVATLRKRCWKKVLRER